MVCNNIFFGDMLLKNFGVFWYGWVVFYDYDELCLVSDCVFCIWLQLCMLEDVMVDEFWFYVGLCDVFFECFGLFMGLFVSELVVVREYYWYLFDLMWWQDLQVCFVVGDYLDMLFYVVVYCLV